jgi:hypothetical protein
VRHFQRWFIQFGEEELGKKYARNSDFWFVFYDFGSKELFHYVPSIPETAGSPAFPTNLEAPNEIYDMAMIDAEEYVDSLLTK